MTVIKSGGLGGGLGGFGVIPFINLQKDTEQLNGEKLDGGLNHLSVFG